MILLDTCAFLWLAEGGSKLSEIAKKRINTAQEVFISAITGFEIGIKFQKGKLLLPAKPEEWVSITVQHHNLRVLPLDLDVCITSTTLPAFHSDPCDRMIIATAIKHNLPVITNDTVYKQYDVETVF